MGRLQHMEYLDKMNAIKQNIESVIVGKSDTITLILTALLAKGHVLLEDMPGTGKTILAKSLAASIDGSYKRVQFTPDLLPSDVTGLNIFNQKQQDFEFKAGPVFSNIFLADEINRATPRTQSCLLEAMAEQQVTTDGVSRSLSSPFFLIATENPVETVGTFPLPEAQLDRFSMRLSLGVPTEDEELAILQRFMHKNPLTELSPVCALSDILNAQNEVENIYIHEDVQKYMVSLVQATRNHEQVIMGVTPRGTLSLMRLSQAYAYLQGRNYVIPEDVKRLAIPCFAHRILTFAGAGASDLSNTIIESITATVPVPTETFSR